MESFHETFTKRFLALVQKVLIPGPMTIHIIFGHDFWSIADSVLQFHAANLANMPHLCEI